MDFEGLYFEKNQSSSVVHDNSVGDFPADISINQGLDVKLCSTHEHDEK